jgi:hypothetical protein
LFHASWAPHGTDVVAGAIPAVAPVERMAPLYRIEAAGTATQISAAQENLVISVPYRSFSCSNGKSIALAGARRGRKAGDSPVQKAARAVDKHADNGWKARPQGCAPLADKCCITWGLPCESRAEGAG